MKVSFHPEAADEYEEAVVYYEDCQTGLGKQLTQEIDASINLILAFPKAWTTLNGEIKRILVRRFPFGLLYILRNDEIYILAVMNLNRKPNYWKERV
jgi:ParE toxin of type II toxin-antitoxin system, parDE